jgi:hypothetical protein
MAVALVQLADLAKLRADYAAAIGALEEAGELGRALGAWGDLSHISGKLAFIRLRTGDFAAARADLERAEQDESQRGVGLSDAGAWLGLVRAELRWREGDADGTVRQCTGLLSWLKGKQSGWWDGMVAVVQARLALAVLADGDDARCRALLADALQVAAGWVERPAFADVIDAIAAFTNDGGGFRDGGGPPDPGECVRRARLAATLLGASHSIRGCFDEGSLDAPAVRDAVRARLGADEFHAAYERGRVLARDDALALAAAAVANPASSMVPSPDRSGSG